MQIKLINTKEGNPLFGSLKKQAVESKIGIYKDDRLLLKVEEYLFLMHNLSMPSREDLELYGKYLVETYPQNFMFSLESPEEIGRMQYESNFGKTAKIFSEKFDSVYLA